MGLTPERVVIKKPVRAKVPGGGKSETFAPIPGAWYATRNFYGRTAQLMRLEQGAHNAAGPGAENKTEVLFVFTAPFPTGIKRDWQIVGGDGVTYNVLFVRSYDDTMQVDTENVG